MSSSFYKLGNNRPLFAILKQHLNVNDYPFFICCQDFKLTTSQPWDNSQSSRRELLPHSSSFFCKSPYVFFFKNGPTPAFFYFRSFQTQILQKKTEGVSRIRTRIVGAEGEHSDQLTTTTAQSPNVRLRLMRIDFLSLGNYFDCSRDRAKRGSNEKCTRVGQWLWRTW